MDVESDNNLTFPSSMSHGDFDQDVWARVVVVAVDVAVIAAAVVVVGLRVVVVESATKNKHNLIRFWQSILNKTNGIYFRKVHTSPNTSLPYVVQKFIQSEKQPCYDFIRDMRLSCLFSCCVLNILPQTFRKDLVP